jgi:hypothetical protein
MNILVNCKFTPEYLAARSAFQRTDDRELRMLAPLAINGLLTENMYLSRLEPYTTEYLEHAEPTTNFSDQSGANQDLGALRRHARAFGHTVQWNASIAAAFAWFADRGQVQPRRPNPLRIPREPLSYEILDKLKVLNLEEVLEGHPLHIRIGMGYMLAVHEGILATPRPREIFDLYFGDGAPADANVIDEDGYVTINNHKSARLGSRLRRINLQIRNFEAPPEHGFIMRDVFENPTKMRQAINNVLKSILALVSGQVDRPIPYNMHLGCAARLLRYSSGHQAARTTLDWGRLTQLFGHSKSIHRKHYY